MKDSTLNLSSIVLAGGLSSRMGYFKPLLPLGRKTLLEHVISVYQSIGINNICIVTGYRSLDISCNNKRDNIKIVYNKKYKDGMFSSVLTGVKHLPEGARYFFIHPVDIPLVHSYTLVELINTAKAKKVDVVYPTFDGKRGHPPLISTKLKDSIIKWKYNGGLNKCLQKNKKTFIEVSVADHGILMDADTPEDYKNILIKFKKKDSLTSIECKTLMEKIANTPNEIINHCYTVAQIAITLAKSINNSGIIKLDIDLINSSSLIHDIARTKKNHAKVGAQLLRNMGYTKMGDIVEQHMNLTVSNNQTITEAEIVYIADKLVNGSRLVNLNDRFKKKTMLYNDNMEVGNNIAHKIENAYKIKNKIEKLTSHTIEQILEKNTL